MSLFHPVNLVCPACGAVIVMQAVGSVNADRRPDLRDDILEDRFQDTTCGACGGAFRLQPEFNYLHVGQGLWIAAMPAPRMPDYLQVEDEVQAIFDASYGSGAPRAARDIGAGLTVRLTFGWPALREKIVARAAGLDDVTLEILKLDMLRAMPSAPLAAGVELRLVRDLGADLGLAWVQAGNEDSAGDEFVVARYAYDAIADAPAAWAALRAELDNGPFVDLQKLFIGRGRGAPPPPRIDPEAILAEEPAP
jgi:hypothetical protein